MSIPAHRAATDGALWSIHLKGAELYPHVFSTQATHAWLRLAPGMCVWYQVVRGFGLADQGPGLHLVPWEQLSMLLW